MIEHAWRDVRRILAVRLDNLGDVLVTTPAIRAVKTALPEATISLLASPVGAQVGQLNPDIADVTVHAAPWVDPWQALPQRPEHELALVERLRHGQFDAAIIFTSYRQSPLPAAYLCYLAGIPLRLAASVDASGSLLTTRHRHPDAPMHEVERGLDLVSAIGVQPAAQHLVLAVPEAARHRVRVIRDQWSVSPWHEGSQPLVVVHPGSSMPARRYPPEQYTGVIESLVGELDAHVAVTGVAAESDLVAQVMQELTPEAQVRVHDMAGELTFPELCALVEESDLVVTNNTGPMHIAAATGTPVIALFAMTNPMEQWGPWLVPHRILNRDVACRHCYQRVCPYEQDCLRPVTASEVIVAARDLGIGAPIAERFGEHALVDA